MFTQPLSNVILPVLFLDCTNCHSRLHANGANYGLSPNQIGKSVEPVDSGLERNSDLPEAEMSEETGT